MKQSFNQEVRNRLDKELRKKKFESKDFYDLVEAHGVHRLSITTQLARMVAKNQVRVIGERQNPHGGGTLKIYEVVPGAEFEVVLTNTERVALHRERLSEQERKLATCARRLDKAMAGWV